MLVTCPCGRVVGWLRAESIRLICSNSRSDFNIFLVTCETMIKLILVIVKAFVFCF